MNPYGEVEGGRSCCRALDHEKYMYNVMKSSEISVEDN